MQNLNSKFKTDLKGRCYQFSIDVISLMDTLPNKRSAWVIADQLIRSATSVGANLTEARASSARRGNRDCQYVGRGSDQFEAASPTILTFDFHFCILPFEF